MTYFHKLRSLALITSLAIPILLISTQPADAQRGGDNDPDRAVKGGTFPAGWTMRPDSGSATNVNFTQAGDVFHFVMGSAGTFSNPAWTKTGNYTFSARMTQAKAPTHPISYGLMIGGSNLEGPMQKYSYFMVRNQGQYFISNRESDARPTTLVNWTDHAAIVKQGPDGRQTNTLGIQVQGEDVIFSVNGAEVTRQPKAKLHTDGLYGFRIGHNIDVDVDQIKR